MAVDGVLAHDEMHGDVRVRETTGHQGEHLPLAAGEGAAASDRLGGSGRRGQVREQRRRALGSAAGADRGECVAGCGSLPLRLGAPAERRQGACEGQASLRRLEGRPRGAVEVGGVLEAPACRVVVTGGGCGRPLREGQGRTHGCGVDVTSDRLEFREVGAKRLDVAARRVGHDGRFERRDATGPVAGRESPEQTVRERRRGRGIPPVEGQRRLPEERQRVGVRLREERLGLVEPALPAPQLGEPDDPLHRDRRTSRRELVDRRRELGLRLGEGAAPDEDGRVVEAAVGEDPGEPPPLAEVAHAGAPLRRPSEVPNPLARRDEVAADARDGDRVAHLATDCGRRGLVERPEARGDLSGGDERKPFERETVHLHVEAADGAADLHRLPAVPTRGGEVAMVEERDLAVANVAPAEFGRGRKALEEPVAPLQPPGGHSWLCPEPGVVVGEPRRHARRADPVARLVVEPVGPLAGVERGLAVLEPPGRHPEPFQRLGRLAAERQRRLEVAPRVAPRPPLEGLAASREGIVIARHASPG